MFYEKSFLVISILNTESRIPRLCFTELNPFEMNLENLKWSKSVKTSESLNIKQLLTHDPFQCEPKKSEALVSCFLKFQLQFYPATKSHRSGCHSSFDIVPQLKNLHIWPKNDPILVKNGIRNRSDLPGTSKNGHQVRNRFCVLLTFLFKMFCLLKIFVTGAGDSSWRAFVPRISIRIL